VPQSLDYLCAALLDADPARRPTARDVLARNAAAFHDGTGLVAPVEEAPLLDTAPLFIGRQDELNVIRDAYARSARGPVLVSLEGPSGIGKTALLENFLA
jgi:hypothetical protein